ncbi:aminopeptidase YwaD [Melghirimyces profundicolus]|uniref:Aminopeptidase YwaD n=1 Tax=Melghirimyces profundicolus TaxID=1242148 RepID=A0A2T6BH27_9BACL|nr:M28 family peptidase [Melghirimyces profundicolus]PTX55359.1 aminopeptidase YwaD [Melghirimyces profundicolus]
MKRSRLGIVFTLALTMVLVFTASAYAAPLQTQDVSKTVSEHRIHHHIAKLADRDNARVTGFEGEHRAADYIAGELEKYGIQVERQKFPIIAFLSHGAELTVQSPVSEELHPRTFTYTPATPEEGLTADLAYAGLGRTGDFENTDVEGKIALIRRGEFTFYEKVQNAARAGAIGAIIFNHSEGQINGTLGQPTEIPAISLSQSEGEGLLDILNAGETVTVTMTADVEMSESYSQNVIGTLSPRKGSADHTKTIVVGAHYDGVDTPAANDNASGTATLLEMARVLADQRLHHEVKVVFFGAEEVGLVGSHRYVEFLSEEERANTAAMINMDMVGVGDTIGIMTATEDADSFVADMAEEYVKTLGEPYERTTSTRSDHVPFEEAGIPVAFLNYHSDPNYHTDEDTLDKIRIENLDHMGTLVTRLTYDMANNHQLPQKSRKGMNVQKERYHNPEYQRK